MNGNGHGWGYSRVSAHRGKKIRHICQGGSILPGGRISLFSMEYVKYRKVIKCRSVIKLIIDQNRLQSYFCTFPEGVNHCSRGSRTLPTPDNFCPFPLYCVCGRVSVRCNAREHALGRVSVLFYVRLYVRDRVHDLVRCGVRVSGRICVVAVPVTVAVPMLVSCSILSQRERSWWEVYWSPPCEWKWSCSGSDRDRCGVRVRGRVRSCLWPCIFNEFNISCQSGHYVQLVIQRVYLTWHHGPDQATFVMRAGLGQPNRARASLYIIPSGAFNNKRDFLLFICQIFLLF